MDCLRWRTVSIYPAVQGGRHTNPTARTIQQLGASFGELTIAPATPTEPPPPLPVEVDDVYIFPHQIQPQQAGVVSLMTGFNLNVRVFLSYSSLATAEMAFGIDEIFDWDRQQRIFEQSLERCRMILDSIPEVLRVQPGPGRESGLPQRQPYYPPMPEFSGLRDPALANVNGPELQDLRRYEIQKANVYASHLATRSYLVEKYFIQLEKFIKAQEQAHLHSPPIGLAAGLDRIVPPSITNGDALEKMMSEEREQVVKDLLVVLGSIDMVNMEPNGDSFVSHPFTCKTPTLYAKPATANWFPVQPLCSSFRKASIQSRAYDLFQHRHKRFGQLQRLCSKCPKSARVVWRFNTKTTCTNSWTSSAS